MRVIDDNRLGIILTNIALEFNKYSCFSQLLVPENNRNIFGYSIRCIRESVRFEPTGLAIIEYEYYGSSIIYRKAYGVNESASDDDIRYIVEAVSPEIPIGEDKENFVKVLISGDTVKAIKDMKKL